MEGVPRAPTFHPTAEEWAGSPLQYITDVVRPVAEASSGIAKIVPPKGWAVPFSLPHRRAFTFTPRVQVCAGPCGVDVSVLGPKRASAGVLRAVLLPRPLRRGCLIDGCLALVAGQTLNALEATVRAHGQFVMDLRIFSFIHGHSLQPPFPVRAVAVSTAPVLAALLLSLLSLWGACVK